MFVVKTAFFKTRPAPKHASVHEVVSIVNELHVEDGDSFVEGKLMILEDDRLFPFEPSDRTVYEIVTFRNPYDHESDTSELWDAQRRVVGAAKIMFDEQKEESQ